MSAENPADAVIEAAAKAICRIRCGPMFIERNGRACNQHQRDGEVAGRTLHNAGLLADPAVEEAQTDLAESEAENAELRATVARVRGLADRWERWGHDGVPIRPSTAAGYLRAALDGAGEQQ